MLQKHLYCFSFISSKSCIPQLSCFNILSSRHGFGRSALSISFLDERKSGKEIENCYKSFSYYRISYNKDIGLHYALFEVINGQIIVPSRSLCRKVYVSNEKNIYYFGEHT